MQSSDVCGIGGGERRTQYKASGQCQNPGGWCAKVGCHKIHDDVEAEEGSLVVLIRSKLIECPSRNGTKCITWMAPSHAADLIKVMDCFFFRLCP